MLVKITKQNFSFLFAYRIPWEFFKDNNHTYTQTKT